MISVCNVPFPLKIFDVKEKKNQYRKKTQKLRKVKTLRHFHYSAIKA